ncbi:MAG TPA: restriction endonuclease subunit S [Candidatus Enterosoma merdigallinarum]|nr:restriction endonuclease subunit S [Candidatus Enterosoma merdigallinarum]
MTEVRLGQIANIFTGKCNAQDAVEDGIYPLFDRSGEVKKSDKYFADCEAIIVPGESTTFIPRYYKGKFNLHQRAYCINPHEDVNGVFLYYLIKANSPYFFSVATGATVASLRLNNFLKMKLNLPLRQAQDKIANILSTYDKLIENNDKRIAILEQEAEELYKEWFVRFRFPGHEKLKFVDGLPFEWSYARFKDIATIIRGVSYSSDEIDVPEGNYLVNLKNIRSYGGYNFNEEKTYIGSYKGTQTLTKLDLIMGVTDMTQDRRCVGSVALCPEFDKPAIISADLIKILSKYSNVFLYCHLKFGNYSKYISEFANGANVLHLRPKYLENIKILMPSKDLIEKFSSICIPIFNNILNLVNQNNNLQNQRDYLLPRLMSGKLEVK